MQSALLLKTSAPDEMPSASDDAKSVVNDARSVIAYMSSATDEVSSADEAFVSPARKNQPDVQESISRHGASNWCQAVRQLAH